MKLIKTNCTLHVRDTDEKIIIYMKHGTFSLSKEELDLEEKINRLIVDKSLDFIKEYKLPITFELEGYVTVVTPPMSYNVTEESIFNELRYHKTHVEEDRLRYATKV